MDHWLRLYVRSENDKSASSKSDNVDDSEIETIHCLKLSSAASVLELDS